MSSTSGLVLYVHDSEYTITEEDHAILASPGKETDIEISRTSIQKQPSPYSDCLSQNDSLANSRPLIEKTIKLTGLYTQQYCLQLCYQNFLLKYCDCYDHTLPKFEPEGKLACPKFIDSLYNCQYLIKRLFYNGKNDKHCLVDCPSECDITHYETRVSSLTFPTDHYKTLLDSARPRSSAELSDKSTLAVNLYYKSGSFTKIVEKPRLSFLIFLSNLGGTFGLFLGVSFLTLVEIVELVYEVTLYFVFFGTRFLSSSAKKPLILSE